MGKTIREFATEFSIDIKQVQNKVAYIRSKNKQFGKLSEKGVREFSSTEIKYLKEVLNVSEKTTESSNEFSSQVSFLKTQIEEKDKQISLLQQALNQQQILTKQVQDQNQNLRLENKGMKEEINEQKNKGFWSRFFNK